MRRPLLLAALLLAGCAGLALATYNPLVAQSGSWSAFSPTTAWTTSTTTTGMLRRSGDTMEGRLYVTLQGAPDSATWTLTIPNGETVDESKLPSAGEVPVGNVWIRDASPSTVRPTGLVVYDTTNNNVRVRIETTSPSTMTLMTQAVPMTFANGDWLELTFFLPITGW